MPLRLLFILVLNYALTPESCTTLLSQPPAEAVGPSKETPGLVPDSVSCPADVLLPNWTNRRPVALDVHVISPFQSLLSKWASNVSCMASNLPNCRSMGLTCIPLVAETLRGLADDFISTMHPGYRPRGYSISI